MGASSVVVARASRRPHCRRGRHIITAISHISRAISLQCIRAIPSLSTNLLRSLDRFRDCTVRMGGDRIAPAPLLFRRRHAVQPFTLARSARHSGRCGARRLSRRIGRAGDSEKPRTSSSATARRRADRPRFTAQLAHRRRRGLRSPPRRSIRGLRRAHGRERAAQRLDRGQRNELVPRHLHDAGRVGCPDDRRRSRRAGVHRDLLRRPSLPVGSGHRADERPRTRSRRRDLPLRPLHRARRDGLRRLLPQRDGVVVCRRRRLHRSRSGHARPAGPVHPHRVRPRSPRALDRHAARGPPVPARPDDP